MIPPAWNICFANFPNSKQFFLGSVVFILVFVLHFSLLPSSEQELISKWSSDHVRPFFLSWTDILFWCCQLTVLGPSMLDLWSFMDPRISCTLHPAPGLQTGGHLSVSSAKSRPCSAGWWQIALFLLLLLLLTIITVINVSSRVTYLDKCVSFSFFTKYVLSQDDFFF